jgi:hypothetical protein
MSRSQLAIVSASFLAALATAGGATAEPASVSSKQAQAESVMAQIQALDGSLEHAVDAYNLANERLNAIRGDLKENRVNLRIAAENLRTAQKVLAARMVAIYTTDQSDSTLDVLVGSRSLEDLLDGLETVSRVSEQDSAVSPTSPGSASTCAARGPGCATPVTGRPTSWPSVPLPRHRSRASSRSGSRCSRRSSPRSRRFGRPSSGDRHSSNVRHARASQPPSR